MDWAGSEPDLWDVLCQGYQQLLTIAVVSILATRCILSLTSVLETCPLGECSWWPRDPSPKGQPHCEEEQFS